MKNIKVLTFILFLLKTGYLVGIPPDELPFGSQALYSYTEAEVRKLAEEMCFNIFLEYGALGAAGIRMLGEHDIQAVRGGIMNWYQGIQEPPVKYSWSCYGEVDVDDPSDGYPNEEVRMVAFGGEYSPDGSLWISHRDSVDTLSGINTHLERFAPDSVNLQYKDRTRNHIVFGSNYYANAPAEGLIIYQLDVNMKIDIVGDTLDAVAFVNLELGGDWNTCQMHIEPVDTIYAGDFISADSIHTISMDFEFPDSVTYVNLIGGSCSDTITLTDLGGEYYSMYLTITIATTGEREVAIDKILISDQFGRFLIAGDYDDIILDKFQEYEDFADTIFGWFLRDEPEWVNFRPFGYIDSLMDSVYSPWMAYTFFNRYIVLTHTYLELVDVDFTLNDIYAFGSNDVYAGEDFQANWNGPLYRLDKHLSWCRERVDRDSAELWFAPQAFNGADWRRPTPSELSCETFMGLSWGSKGIIYWFYDGPIASNHGIRDDNHQETTLYYQIKDHIAPYIQAFDEHYMPLVWDTTYTYKAGLYSPPDGGLIDTIYAAFNDPDSSSPDLGWFHVGEFHDTTGNKYIMLVNRACSQGPNDPTEAGSITAFVKFDPTNLGLGDYVYIIDIADSVYYDTSLSTWVGVPDTTYSAKLDGTIPFTTALSAGEGRLFKIVATEI